MKKFLLYFAILASFAAIVSCVEEEDPSVAVTGVSISPESIEMEISEQKVLTVTITPEDATNKNVKFTSSKETVAIVSQDGVVEALSVGSTIVTATSEDGNYKSYCAVTVKEKTVQVTGISLNKTSLSLTVGEEFTLVPTVTPEDAADKSVVWTSDNEEIVTVSSEGIVKAVKAGKATVTATTVDQQKTATCSIDVTERCSAVTGEASHISCRSAEIAGKANVPGTATNNMSLGVLYSTSSGLIIGSATQIAAEISDSEYNFTVSTEMLEPETTYYYRCYIILDTEIFYGEVKSFKTLAVSSMIETSDATDINPKDAILNASLNLTDCKYEALEYGFELTPVDGNANTVKANNYSEKAFSVKYESLSMNAKYSYMAYVTLDGRTYKGSAKTFTTPSVQAYVSTDVSNVSYYTAKVFGQLAVTSEGTFTKSATLYYSSTASTLDALKASGAKIVLTLNLDTFSQELSSLAPNTKYNYAVVCKVDDVEFTDVESFTTAIIPETVDLGLSVKWRAWNVGAAKPEEYGTYFAWGATTGQTWNGSSWSGGGFETYPSYELDANNNLKPKYDAASVNLGGTWRMPTKAEFQELKDNCTKTWTSDYNGTGVAGAIFTSKKEGYTDKFIFLPAAGKSSSQGSTLLDLCKGQGEIGNYWSSTINSDSPEYAWKFIFTSTNSYNNDDSRYCGISVRPVTE